MIQKDCYGFNTFATTWQEKYKKALTLKTGIGLLIGWREARNRGRLAFEAFGLDGPIFLKQRKSEWLISRNYAEQKLPDDKSSQSRHCGYENWQYTNQGKYKQLFKQ